MNEDKLREEAYNFEDEFTREASFYLLLIVQF